MTICRLFWMPLLVLCVTRGQAWAQSGESRLEKLEDSVRMLERRVVALEEQLVQRNKSAGVPTDKSNWRKLERGISQAEVERILGSPTKVDAFGLFTIWHYGYPAGGRVQFDGRNNAVSGWQEP